MPVPAMLMKNSSLILHVSITSKSGFFKRDNALAAFLPIPKCILNPFPEPPGIIANAVLLPTRAPATSFTVPSPPTAAIISASSLTPLVANSMAWPAYSV